MSEWKKCAIGDVVTLRQGFAINAKSKHYISKEPTSLALLRIADMKSGSREIYVKEDIPKNFIALPQDIVYTRTGNVGLVFRKNYGVVHNNCFTVTPNDEKTLSRDFLYYLLQSKYFFEKANSLARGAAQPDLPHSLFNSIEISYPELNCQQQIASILSRYDSLIENYQKQIKLLEEAAQRLYKEWFVDLHFPGHENIKIVNGVPEGWEKKKISEVCDTIGGGTPSTKVLSYYENGTISWVTPTDITKNNSLCLLSTEKKITKEGLDHSSAKMLPAETILMTSRASVGFFGICDFEVCTNQGFISCVPFDNNFQMYLLYNLMNRVEEIRIKAGGSTYLEISKSVFRNFDIIYPTDDLICVFQKETHRLLVKMRLICKQIRLLTEARDRMLPKLMSGEIAVEGGRPERPLSCQPNGNALGMETETNNRPVGAKD